MAQEPPSKSLLTRVGMVSKTGLCPYSELGPLWVREVPASTCLFLVGISLMTGRGQTEVGRCVPGFTLYPSCYLQMRTMRTRRVADWSKTYSCCMVI